MSSLQVDIIRNRVGNGSPLFDRGIVVAGLTTLSGQINAGSVGIASTEVISSAFQLKNILSVDSTTLSTLETALAIGPNDFTSLNVSGISTLTGNVFASSNLSVTSNLNVGGAASITGSAFITGDLTSRNFRSSGISSSYIGFTTYLSGTNLNYAGVGTIATLISTAGTVTYLNGTNANYSGIITAPQLSTGASGTGININTNTITGPSLITIDPAAIGDDTGSVRIKGNLLIDGTQTYINSTTVEIADFNVGIATTVASDAELDGAGIGIGSQSIRKTISWRDSISALSCSNHFNLENTNAYYINDALVLDSQSLGAGVTQSSLTSVGTLDNLSVTNTVFANDVNSGTFNGDSIDVTDGFFIAGFVTHISGISLNYIGISTVENARGTTLSYSGISTLTNARGTSLEFTGIGTLTNARGTTLNYSGIGTISDVRTNTILATTGAGIITATSIGCTSLTASGISTITNARGTSLNFTGVGTLTTLNSNVGVVTFLSGTSLQYTGLGTITSLGSGSIVATSATITNLDNTFGSISTITGTSLNYTGIGTLTNARGTTLDYSGIGSITHIRGTSLSYSGISTVTNARGTSLDFSGIGTIAHIRGNTLSIVGGAGIATATSIACTSLTASGVATVTSLNATSLTVSGVSTFSNTLNVNASVNVQSGSDYRINSATVLNNTTLGSSVVNSSLTSVGTLTNLNVSGITTVTRLSEKVTGDFNDATGLPTAGSPTSVLTIDCSLGTVFVGDVTGDIDQWAFTNVPTGTGKAIEVTVITESDTAQAYGDLCSVNGTSVAVGVYWEGGVTPTPTGAVNPAYDVFRFLIVTDSGSSTLVFGNWTQHY